MGEMERGRSRERERQRGRARERERERERGNCDATRDSVRVACGRESLFWYQYAHPRNTCL